MCIYYLERWIVCLDIKTELGNNKDPLIFRTFIPNGQKCNRWTRACLGGNPSFLDTIKNAPPSIAICECKVEYEMLSNM